MNKKIKKSKRPLQVKLMIAVTVIAVLVIIPLTSNIMEDVFRITGRQKGYSEETLFQCFIDNEYGMLTDKIEYNKGVGRKITKEEENYYAFSDCYNAAVDYKMYIKNNEMTKAEEMLDKFRKNEEKITGRIFIDALVSIKEVYGINKRRRKWKTELLMRQFWEQEQSEAVYTNSHRQWRKTFFTRQVPDLSLKRCL